jgi:hypothetical protein
MPHGNSLVQNEMQKRKLSHGVSAGFRYPARTGFRDEIQKTHKLMNDTNKRARKLVFAGFPLPIFLLTG